MDIREDKSIDLSDIRVAIIDLYLDVKIRSTEEVSPSLTFRLTSMTLINSI